MWAHYGLHDQKEGKLKFQVAFGYGTVSLMKFVQISTTKRDWVINILNILHSVKILNGW
jgi:hypothetical protein